MDGARGKDLDEGRSLLADALLDASDGLMWVCRRPAGHISRTGRLGQLAEIELILDVAVGSGGCYPPLGVVGAT